MGLGRCSHSCSESLSKPPTPQKSYARRAIPPVPLLPQQQSWNPPSTSDIPPTSLWRLAFNCQSIISNCKKPTHPLMGTFLLGKVGKIYTFSTWKKKKKKRHPHLMIQTHYLDLDTAKSLIRWNRRGARSVGLKCLLQTLHESQRGIGVPLIATQNKSSFVPTH